MGPVTQSRLYRFLVVSVMDPEAKNGRLAHLGMGSLFRSDLATMRDWLTDLGRLSVLPSSATCDKTRRKPSQGCPQWLLAWKRDDSTSGVNERYQSPLYMLAVVYLKRAHRGQRKHSCLCLVRCGVARGDHVAYLRNLYGRGHSASKEIKRDGCVSAPWIEICVLHQCA